MENKQVLTQEVDIQKAERILTRARFSVYFRRLNTENYKKELQSLEKIQRFLTNESNISHMEQSNMWKGMSAQISKHVTEYTNAINLSKTKEENEVAFLEEINSKVYGEKLYDKEYFETLFKYAEVNGDTSEYEPDFELMLKSHGFLNKDTKVEETKA